MLKHKDAVMSLVFTVYVVYQLTSLHWGVPILCNVIDSLGLSLWRSATKSWITLAIAITLHSKKWPCTEDAAI